MDRESRLGFSAVQSISAIPRPVFVTRNGLDARTLSGPCLDVTRRWPSFVLGYRRSACPDSSSTGLPIRRDINTRYPKADLNRIRRDEEPINPKPALLFSPIIKRRTGKHPEARETSSVKLQSWFTEVYSI